MALPRALPTANAQCSAQTALNLVPARTFAARASCDMLVRVLFKVVQVTIAAGFSFIIVTQASLRGLIRKLWGPPALLAKASCSNAEPIQASKDASKPAKGFAGIQIRAVAADKSMTKPMHVFNEHGKGEMRLVLLPADSGALAWLSTYPTVLHQFTCNQPLHSTSCCVREAALGWSSEFASVACVLSGARCQVTQSMQSKKLHGV